ncbi:NAD-dependent epimerase/dehydratase family protein [Actinokineospora enzanensis]|uniref:NAD-dependent epimerase/dehydratase family protein n=1 Tax=Actinokineospora enzanensis TaxID=155975 RepID=UPI0003A671DA|nr:NAD-dependent epimerase/dehydratase family protein [Actinokineospora enzanensis]
MRVLVVGGTGLLGQHTSAELKSRGHEVSTLARQGDASVLGDVQRLSESEWTSTLHGFDGVVWATGADDRHVPRAPAERFFHDANVAALRRMLDAAREARCGRVVVFGSYFTALHRAHPGWGLAEHHPYVRSRLGQIELATEHSGDGMTVAVLEIPLVFGSAEGRRPLWAPAVPWLRSRLPLVSLTGGTAVTSAVTVGQAAAGAVERAADGAFPVADANLTWRELVARLAVAAGRREPVRVYRLPRVVVHAGIRGVGLWHRLTGRESGLTPARVPGLLMSELYVDESVCRTGLGVTGGDLADALRDTISASLRRDH